MKWPINLRLDICEPLHRSHFSTSAVVSAQPPLESIPLFSREVIRPTLRPPVPPSIQDRQQCGRHEAFTSKAFSQSRSAETSPRASPESTEVFGFTRRVEKHRSVLVVGHQSRGPERRRFICRSCSPVRLIRVYTPCFLYFDSCCGQSYRLFNILADLL